MSFSCLTFESFLENVESTHGEVFNRNSDGEKLFGNVCSAGQTPSPLRGYVPTALPVGPGAKGPTLSKCVTHIKAHILWYTAPSGRNTAMSQQLAGRPDQSF